MAFFPIGNPWPTAGMDPTTAEAMRNMQRTQQMQGVMGLGAGLMGAAFAPPSQRGQLMAQGVRSLGAGLQSPDPASLMSMRYQGAQMKQMEEKAAADRAARERWSAMLPGGSPTAPERDPRTVQAAMAAGGGPTPAAASLMREATPTGGPTGLMASFSPEEQQLLQALGPEAGMNYMAQQMAQRVKPEKDERTALQKNAEAAGLKPGTPEYNDFLKKSILKPPVSVRMEGPIPAGHSVVRDPNTGAITALQPIAGGPADPARSKEYKKSLDTIGRVQSSLDSYEAMLNRVGAEILPGESKLQLESAYTDILLEMKELFNLGVLNGPDLELMQSYLIDPTSIRAKSLEAVHGKGALTSQLGLVRQKLESARERAQTVYGGGAAPETPEAEGAFNEGDTATNPATGQRMTYRNGRWVPM